MEVFKAVIKDSKPIKSAIDAVVGLVTEANVKITSDGFTWQAMDPAHVALIDFEIKKSAFSEYKLSKKSISVGIDLVKLGVFLNRAGADDKVTLKVDSDGNQLLIGIKNAAYREFNLVFIELTDEETKVPTINFSCTFEVISKIIDEGIKDVKVVGGDIVFSADKEGICISGSGDTSGVNITIPKEELVSFEVGEDIRSLFSFEYVENILKAKDVSPTVIVSFGTNIPIKLDYLSSDIRLSFLLAPRIESE